MSTSTSLSIDRAHWPAVLAVALGIFSLVTTELLPVGLLTSVGATLDVSDGTAGLMVTVPALIAAAAAPAVILAARRVDRRLLLAALAALLAAANLLSAIAPSFEVLLAARVLVGLSIGGFWAMAGGLAVRLVPGRSVGLATSIIFGGVATASVLGVPAGTLLGDVADWRVAFGVMAGLSLAVLIALATSLPSLPAHQGIAITALSRVSRDAGVRIGLLATFLLVTGHFSAYTYVRPVLEEVSHVDPSAVSSLLLGYGVAGIFGNFAAGTVAMRNVRMTLLAIAAALTVAMVAVPLLGRGAIGAAAVLLAWGLAYGGVSVTLQTWMLTAAPRATEAASALFVSVFNVSISLGALLGGLAVDGLATQSVMWLGAGVVLLTVACAMTQTHASHRVSPDRIASPEHVT